VLLRLPVEVRQGFPRGEVNVSDGSGVDTQPLRRALGPLEDCTDLFVESVGIGVVEAGWEAVRDQAGLQIGWCRLGGYRDGSQSAESGCVRSKFFGR
jgi:hypothetical protein